MRIEFIADDIEIWQPSVRLRWLEKKRSSYAIMHGFPAEKVLQQLRVSNGGKLEWKDIPTEKEE